MKTCIEPSASLPYKTAQLGNWSIHEWVEAQSTNDLARQLPPWSIARADVQTAGRGRFNRSWIGAAGGLWNSFTLPLATPSDGHHPNWGLLPLIAGLALVDFVHSLDISNVRLRWPNDLMVGESKLAGILVERPRDDMAVVGIGINMFNDTASLIGQVKNHPTRLVDLTQNCPSVRDAMLMLATHLETTFNTFIRSGETTVLNALSTVWGGVRRVSIETDEGTQTGDFIGIQPDGSPIIQPNCGPTVSIPAHLVNRLVELT